MRYVTWLIGNDWRQVDSDGDGVKDSYGEGRGILRGDFGISFKTRRPVIDEIRDRLPNTIYLISVTLLITFLIAIPVGIISAIRQYSFYDIFATSFSFMGQSVPSFWLGLILIPAIPAEQMHGPVQRIRLEVSIKKKRVLTKTPECNVKKLLGMFIIKTKWI